MLSKKDDIELQIEYMQPPLLVKVYI